MDNKLKVLLIEESQENAGLVLNELNRAGFEVQHSQVQTPRAMQTAVEIENWDVVIANYSMPHFRGSAILKIIQKSGKDLPVILISSIVGDDLAVSAIKAGGHDYLMKEDLGWLGPVVQKKLSEVRNRSSRNQAEEELRRLKEFHEDIVQNIFDGIIVDDVNQVLTFVNPAASRMLGYGPRELESQNWTLIVPPDQRELVKEAYQRRTQGIADRYELSLIRKDGTRIPVLVSGAPRYSNGCFNGTMAVFTDISERKRIEDELRKLKEFNERIIHNMFEGVGVGDESGIFNFVNPAMAKMLGYAPEELVGTHWAQTVPPDQYSVVESADDRRRQGRSDRYEVELLRKDGSRFSAEISGNPIYEDDKFIGSMVVFTDITTRKEAERTLRRRAEELTALHDASLKITAPHTFSSLIHSILEQAKMLLNVPGGALSLCRPERGEINVYEEVTPQGINYSGQVLKYGEGAAGWVVENGKPLILEDYRTWPNRSSLYKDDQTIRACLSVPLIWRGQIKGVLQVSEKIEGRYFSHEDLELLSLFADQAAIALENSRLFDAERIIREQAETLRDVAQVLSASLDFDTVLHQILTQIKRLIVFDTANVFLFGTHGKPDRMAGIGYNNEYATSRAAINLLRDSRILRRIAENFQSILIADVRDDPDWIWVPGAEHVRSFLCVPILLQNHMAGALMVDSKQVGFFSDEDLRLTQSMAQHMSIAIQNARLYEAEHAARERAEALREAARIISLSLSLDEVLGAVLEQLSRVLPFDSGSTMLVENGKIVIKVGRGYDTPGDKEIYKQVLFDFETDQTCGLVIRSGQPLVIPDVLQDPRWIVTELSKPVRSWLGVPLVTRDQVIGLFSLDRKSLDKFSDDEVALAQTFASHAGTAITNARLYQAEEQRAAELMALRQASLSLTASLELESVLHAILDSALGFLPGSGNAHIYLYREEDQSLTFGAALWADGQIVEPLTAPRQNGLTYLVAHSGETQVVNNMGTDPLYKFSPRHWNGAIVGLPLKIGQHVMGVMNVVYPSPHQFSESELRVLGLLSDQAAIAVENARLFERAATERRHLSLLYDLGRELASALDYDEILDRAISLTCQALGGGVGEAFLFNPATGTLTLRSLYGLATDVMVPLNQMLSVSPGIGLAGWVAVNKQPIVVKDVLTDQRWIPVYGIDEDVHAAILAPIVDNERVLGVITVLHREIGVFIPDHIKLLQAICQQVSLAIINAENYLHVQSLVDRLASEQSRLESLLERLPVGVLLLDSDYHLQVANLLGRQILSCLNPKQPGQILTHLGYLPIDEFCQTYNPSIHSGDALPTEIALETPKRTLIEAEARPIGEETRQWVVVLRDITQERDSQERIKIQERLATVGQLAAGIAHDFNNIMAAILAYSDLLISEKNLSESSRERLGIIQQQVQRAASLIRQILDFSRRSVMDQISMDLLPFVKELDHLLSRVLPETIRLESSYQPGDYMVSADPTRLQQVFMNLALNARDAMPDGGTLRFELSRFYTPSMVNQGRLELPAGDWVRIAIIDSGQGISADVLPHIYDPFFTTKPVGKGTGLGLAQVYGIIKQHQGHIDVLSQPGQGAQFIIYLPALVKPKDFDDVVQTSKQVDGTGHMVLVVEDDQVTREALKALLQAQNFLVVTASNGYEAIKVLETNPTISLVISDIVMPELGGVALFNTIHERWEGIKVLFITGHPLDPKDQILLEKGGINWLQKPFSVHDLNQAIQDFLN